MLDVLCVKRHISIEKSSMVNLMKIVTKVGASIHQIGSLFGPGMDPATAGTMIKDWGCNNIIVGLYV